MKDNWNLHYVKVTEKKFPPSATLTKALSLFESERILEKNAIDLGCGTGIDTIELLRKDWKVTAIDNQSSALNQLKQNALPFFDYKLKLIHQSFEFVDLPLVNLVNASFSLPFCDPENFEDFWENVVSAIDSEGRFAGHFFGMNDSWAKNPQMTFLTEKQIQHLFKRFEIEWIEESEKDGKTIGGKEKHWHVFHIVAKKLSQLNK